MQSECADSWDSDTGEVEHTCVRNYEHDGDCFCICGDYTGHGFWETYKFDGSSEDLDKYVGHSVCRNMGHDEEYNSYLDKYIRDDPHGLEAKYQKHKKER